MIHKTTKKQIAEASIQLANTNKAIRALLDKGENVWDANQDESEKLLEQVDRIKLLIGAIDEIRTLKRLENGIGRYLTIKKCHEEKLLYHFTYDDGENVIEGNLHTESEGRSAEVNSEDFSYVEFDDDLGFSDMDYDPKLKEEIEDFIDENFYELI